MRGSVCRQSGRAAAQRLLGDPPSHCSPTVVQDPRASPSSPPCLHLPTPTPRCLHLTLHPLGFNSRHTHLHSSPSLPSLAAPRGPGGPGRPAQVVKADFDDRPSLEAAFQGCDAVFAVTGGCRECSMQRAACSMGGAGRTPAPRCLFAGMLRSAAAVLHPAQTAHPPTPGTPPTPPPTTPAQTFGRRAAATRSARSSRVNLRQGRHRVEGGARRQRSCTCELRV